MRMGRLISGAIFASTAGLALISSPASAFVFQFNENGTACVVDAAGGCAANPVQGVLAPDPTHRVAGDVLIYHLPSDVTAGDVGINDFGTQTLSDILSFTNSDGTLTGASATLMIFYSELGGPALADTGFPLTGLSANYIVGTSENANGTFDWEPGGNSYFGTSPEGVPEPITLSLFGAGLVGAAALRRRKTKSA